MVAAGIVAVTGPAYAALTTACIGTAENVTVHGDFVVPAGKSCELTNVVVQGKTTVRKDANLITVGSTFGGRIVVRQNGYLDLSGTTVSGATNLRSAYGGYLEDSTFGGTVRSADSGFLYSIGSHHDGQFVSNNGATYIESGWLSKNLTTTGDSLTDLTDTVVNGKVAIADADGGSVMCASEIDGATAVSGAGADGIVQIGTTGPIADCAFNVFASSLTLNGNHGPVSVSGNVIRGDLSCADNDVPPTGSDKSGPRSLTRPVRRSESGRGSCRAKGDVEGGDCKGQGGAASWRRSPCGPRPEVVPPRHPGRHRSVVEQLGPNGIAFPIRAELGAGAEWGPIRLI